MQKVKIISLYCFLFILAVFLMLFFLNGKNNNLSNISSVVQIIDNRDLSNLTDNKELKYGGVGWFYKKTGLIITASHVVNNANSKFSILLNNGNIYSVEVAAFHPYLDLAILRVEELGGISGLDVDTNHNLELEQVVSIDSPIGNLNGNIIGLNESLYTPENNFSGMIKIDTIIDSGFSGSPVLVDNKKVVGMILAREDQNGYAMVMPIDPIDSAINSYLADGDLKIAYLGANTISLSVEKADELGIVGGLLVTGDFEKGRFAVVAESPAEEAGLKSGDIIVSFDGNNISSKSLEYFLVRKEPSERVEIIVWRKGEELLLEVELGDFSEK